MSKFPFLMKIEEKHDNSYYLVEDQSAFIRVAYSLLKERYEEGYWYPTVEQAQKELRGSLSSLRNNFDADLLALTEDEVQALPESLREKAIAQREEFTAREARITVREESMGDLWFAREIERLMSLPAAEALEDTLDWRGKQVNTVQRLFIFRSDFQYEGFDSLRLSEVPDYS